MEEANTETWVDFRVENSLESVERSEEESWQDGGGWVDLRDDIVDDDYLCTFEREYEEPEGSSKIFFRTAASDTGYASWVKTEDDCEKPEMNETKSYCASGRLDCGRQNNSKWPLILAENILIFFDI